MVKKIILVVAALVIGGQNLNAQSGDAQTLLKSRSWKSVGFMAASNVGFSKVDEMSEITMNYRTGIIFNDRFSVGGFYNFTINNFAPKSETAQNVYLDYKAMGAFLEYTIFSSKVVHATFPILVGGGQVEMDSEGHDPNLGQTTFAIVEPGVLCEMNLHKFVRFNLGVTYRAIGKMNYRTLDQNQLSGLSFQTGLKLGLFKK